MKEIFKPIKGLEGLYSISNLGRVRNEKFNRILNPSLKNNGYYYHNLSVNGKKKNFYIHRLIAEAFIPNPYDYPVINHKDENKTNNSIDNLEWCTIEYNLNYGTRNYRISKANSNRRNKTSKIK